MQAHRKHSKGQFVIPLMNSYKERSTDQAVVMISPYQYRKLKKEYSDGIDVSLGYDELDRILTGAATSVSHLLCINDARCFDEEVTYHGFMQVFGGKVCTHIG